MNDEVSSRNVIIAFVILAVAILIGGGLLLSTRPQPVEIVINPPIPTWTPEPSPTSAPILVYVTGAVVNSGATVELPAGSRVQDALNAAGGITGNADRERMNLAALVRDGDHVHVYAVGERETVVLPTPSGGGLVYVNTASLEELETLPGIGPALAQRIIDYREANGPFADLAALGRVNGIGPVILGNVENLVSFE